MEADTATQIAEAELAATQAPQPTEYQIQQFLDVRMLLAWLYKYCLADRKHLKKTNTMGISEVDQKELDQWHFWLTSFMVLFMQKRWKGINLSDPPPPKLPDDKLLQLTNHIIFESKSMDDYTKASKLLSAERKVLKELALRLSPNA